MIDDTDTSEFSNYDEYCTWWYREVWNGTFEHHPPVTWTQFYNGDHPRD